MIPMFIVSTLSSISTLCLNNAEAYDNGWWITAQKGKKPSSDYGAKKHAQKILTNRLLFAPFAFIDCIIALRRVFCVTRKITIFTKPWNSNLTSGRKVSTCLAHIHQVEGEGGRGGVEEEDDVRHYVQTYSVHRNEDYGNRHANQSAILGGGHVGDRRSARDILKWDNDSIDWFGGEWFRSWREAKQPCQQNKKLTIKILIDIGT